MLKKNIILSFIILFLIFNLAIAQEEKITITTYYPSPYGAYNELKTNRLIIGNATSPQDDGVVSFQALEKPPINSETEAVLYYDSSKHTFRYYNGANWVNIPRIERGVYKRGKQDRACVSFSLPFNNIPLVNVYPLGGKNFALIETVNVNEFCIKYSKATEPDDNLMWIALGD